MPVGGISLTLPIEIKLIFTAMRVSDTVLDSLISKAAFATF
jgi:hypothetical protein